MPVALLTTPAFAQTSPSEARSTDAQQLAKQLANPIADLVSVPFQINWDFGLGPQDDMRTILNFQPVMPFSMNEEWNVITRVIVPVISQPALESGGSATFGFGDILASCFFSPARSKKLTWGIGPAISLPMSANATIGSEKWGVGPTLVFLKQTGSWTYGGLANHIWSIAGEEDRSDVNQTFLQPFLAYSTQSAWTFTINSESSANWEAPSGEEWTVPVHVVTSKVVKLGRRPMSVGFGAGYYADKPEGGPEWKLRSFLTLIFPK